jgi:hypothetical protein
LNRIIQEEEEEGASTFTSPVAHRTRGHRPSSNPDESAAAAPRTIVANAYGSPARPLRAAKQKAVARIKGKGKAEEDEDEDEQMDLEDGVDEEEESEVLVLSSDSEGVRGGQNGRRKTGEGRRRRSSRTAVKQVETPPSDADEESGGEEGADEAVEVRSNLRAAGKGGKVVKLRNGHKSKRDEAEDEEDEPELGEDDGEDQDMEADYEEEEEPGEFLFSSPRVCPLISDLSFFRAVVQMKMRSICSTLPRRHYFATRKTSSCDYVRNVKSKTMVEPRKSSLTHFSTG